MAFKDTLAVIKELLKANLKDDNIDFITKVDKELDNLSATHEQTEKDLSETKDKLIEVVKETSFKKESDAENDIDGHTDQPMNIDDAIESTLKEIEANRK